MVGMKREKTIDSIHAKCKRGYYEQFYAKRLKNIDKSGKPGSQRKKIFE